MEKKYKILIVILILLLIILGVAFGWLLFGKKQIKCSNTEPNLSKGSYEDGWRAAREKMIEAGMLPDLDKQTINQINGTVLSTEQGKIQIKTLKLDPLADEKLVYRTINIDNDNGTKIYKIVQKSDSEYENDLNEFYAKNPEYKNSGISSPEEILPPKIKKQEANFNDITASSSIDILAEKDIKYDKEINAKEITIYPW